jgi:hypothetical protein
VRRRARAKKTPEGVALGLVRVYGARADEVASNRYDAARREETAGFYERVLACLRENRPRPVDFPKGPGGAGR